MPLKRFAQADIVLSRRRRLEMPLLAMVWLGVLAFGLAERSAQAGVFYLLLASIAVGVNLFAARRQHEVSLPRRVVNAAVLAATAIVLLEWMGTAQPMLVTLGHYLILIQLCKLFEQKRHRDYVQLIVLSLLLVVAGAMVCDTLFFTAAALAHLVVACHTVMVFTLRRGLAAAGEAALSTEDRPPNPQVVAWNVIRDWPARALRGRLVVVLLAVLLTGAIMFLVAPRTSWSGVAGEAASRREGISGFTGSLRLGDERRIYLSDRVVMSVTVESADGGPPPRIEYLRGRVVERYADGAWSGGSRAVVTMPGDVPEDAIVQHVAIDRALLPTLFATYPAVRCEADHGAPQINSAMELALAVQAWTGSPMRYTAWSLPASLPADSGRWLHGDVPQNSPASDVSVPPAVADLAARWCAELKESHDRLTAELVQRLWRFSSGQLPPQRAAAEAQALAAASQFRDDIELAIARRIAERLREDYAYTLDLTAPAEGRDPLEHFLFDARAGHCEYFASAHAALCASLGVHARVAMGFRVDPPAEGATYTVRARDAHAWTEVYTPSTGWVRFDPTPPGRWHEDRSWWSGVTDLWESVKFYWREKVVGYDSTARRRLGQWFADVYHAVAGAVVAAAATVRGSLVNLLVHGHVDRALGYITLVVSSVGTLLLFVLILRLIRRERRYRRALTAGRAPNLRQTRFLVRLMKALRRRGLSPEDGEGRQQTLRQLLATAARRFSLPPEEMRQLADLYYAIRWGFVRVPEAELAAAEAKVDDIGRQLRGAHGKLRR